MPKKPELTEADVKMRADIGAGVKEMRERLGAAPGEIAAVCGISLAHQYRIEAGDRIPDVLYLYKLVKRYGPLPVVHLFGLDPRAAGVTAPNEERGKGISQSSSGANTIQIGTAGGRVSVKTRR